MGGLLTGIHSKLPGIHGEFTSLSFCFLKPSHGTEADTPVASFPVLWAGPLTLSPAQGGQGSCSGLRSTFTWVLAFLTGPLHGEAHPGKGGKRHHRGIWLQESGKEKRQVPVLEDPFQSTSGLCTSMSPGFPQQQ